MTSNRAKSNVVGVYLAAGLSRRMGVNKLMLPMGPTQRLGGIALKACLASCLDNTFVVTQPDDGLEWMDRQLLNHPRWEQVRCANAIDGQAESLKSGIQAAENALAEAVVVVLADQPLVTSEIINQLVRTFQQPRESGHPVAYVAAQFQGILRPPILLSKAMFPALYQLSGDVGARHIIRGGTGRNNKLAGLTMPIPSPDVFFDVDTQEDYVAIRGLLSYS